MITFDLKCSAGHVFEGWFRSTADFDMQAAAALIPCPMCGDCGVSKAVMAPNIARKGNQLPAPAAPEPTRAAATAAPMMTAADLPPPIAAMAAALAAAQAEALPKSTWVGDQFAAQARAMHQGEQDHALIHGQATRDEAEALIDDGVPILPLLVPVVPPELQN
jgi:hypothetical protein